MSLHNTRDCLCASWCVTYGIVRGEYHHRDCKHCHRDMEAVQTKSEIVVIGTPESDDESHNCDAMGCTSVSHVLFRFPLQSAPVSDDARTAVDLTDEQIDKIIGSCHEGRVYPQDALMLPKLLRRTEARAILAAAKAQPGRKPLTDVEILTMYTNILVSGKDMIAFAHLVETAHGIKGVES